jgi:hypothetical protein
METTNEVEIQNTPKATAVSVPKGAETTTGNHTKMPRVQGVNG